MIENREIAAALDEMGDLLEITEANVFRVRAYRNAARTVAEHPVPMRTLVADQADLTELPAIGKDMARHITELVVRGALTALDDLAEQVPRSLIQLMRLPGVGPKRARTLWETLGIETVADLRRAAEAQRVRGVPGFGPKTEAKILAGIATLEKRGNRTLLAEADQLVQPLVAHLEAHPAVERVAVAGSYRRRLETVGDIDLLATTRDPEGVMAHFTSYARVRAIEGAGDTRATVILDSGLQVDLRIVEPEAYGAALQYFTGSKAHNIVVRQRAIDAGLKMSEYGVFRGEERIAGATEQDVYATVGLPVMPPEIREDRGEIAAADQGRLPRLLELGDLQGDLQMHSTWSDGKESLRTMAEACRDRGYAYMAITDHSKNLAMTGGLDAARARKQWQEIDEVRNAVPEVHLFRSMEVDILRDGTLDLDDATLAELDLVLVSLHTLLELPPAEQTARILRALRHPAVDIFAHPTARIINQREPAAFDMDAVLHTAKEHGVALECNAHPNRLDLRDIHLMAARELDIPIVLSTDAHRVRELDLMRYGVEQARRAWLEPRHVLNTRPLAGFRQWLTSRH